MAYGCVPLPAAGPLIRHSCCSPAPIAASKGLSIDVQRTPHARKQGKLWVQKPHCHYPIQEPEEEEKKGELKQRVKRSTHSLTTFASSGEYSLSLSVRAATDSLLQCLTRRAASTPLRSIDCWSVSQLQGRCTEVKLSVDPYLERAGSFEANLYFAPQMMRISGMQL